MTTADGLVAALARAQLAFPAITKGHENPAFKGSKYADVADVLDAVRPVLAAEGIAVSQVTQTNPDTGGVELVTNLLYGSEILDSRFPLAVVGLTDQQVGSKLTYHRRYQLCALLGVHPVGDDDDGNLAATAPPVRQATAAPSTVEAPDDWQTRPLAQMTFNELRAVAVLVGHSFSGGSKSELIRQLDPLVKSASGAEPFDVTEKPLSWREQATALEGGDRPPFDPVLAGAAADSGTARRQNAAAAAAVRRDEPT